MAAKRRNISFNVMDVDELVNNHSISSPISEVPLNSDSDKQDWKIVADYVDATTAAHEAKERKERRNPELQFNGQHPTWKFQLQIFQGLLTEKMKTRNVQDACSEIFREEFNEVQQLLLEPSCNSRRAQLQELNSKRYIDNLAQRFLGVKNNIVTKFTMASLGLPVQPITMTNIANAGKNEDDTDDDDVDMDDVLPNIRRNQYFEKPLEFLDKYDERSYGYPMLRISKPHPEYKKALEQFDICGYDIRPQSHMVNENPNRSELMTAFPSETAIDTYVPRLRGGAGPVGTIFTDFGSFKTSGTAQELEDIIVACYPRIGHNYEWEKIAIDTVINPGDHRSTRSCDEFLGRIGGSSNGDDALNTLAFALHDADQQVRIRLANWGEADFDEAADDHPNNKPIIPKSNSIVHITLDETGTVYWELPVTTGLDARVEHYELSFRRAIELLIKDHFKSTILCELGNTQYRLDLFHPPTLEFCNGVIKAIEGRKSGEKIEIKIVDVHHDEATPELIFAPGCNPTRYIRNHQSILEQIRSIIYDNARHGYLVERIRIWPSIRYYDGDEDDDSVLILANSVSDENDDESLEKIENRRQNAGIVVIRPVYLRYTATDDSTGNKAKWISGQSRQSLATDLATQIWSGSFDDQADSFQAMTPKNGGLVVCGPEMTERQFRFDVFDRLWGPQLFARRMNDKTRERKLNKKLVGVLSKCNVSLVPRRKLVIDEPISPIEGSSLHSQARATASSLQASPPIPLQTIENGPRSADIINIDDDTKTWFEYQKRQEKEEEIRVQSFLENQSIHISNDEYRVPRYGSAAEARISAGAFMPTVYVDELVPSEVDNLKAEIRRLENIILERVRFCPVCDVQLPTGEHHNREARKHFESHRLENLELACPYCGEPRWQGMDALGRRIHLERCIPRNAPIGNILATTCPSDGCNVRLGNGTLYSSIHDISVHILSHAAHTAGRGRVSREPGQMRTLFEDQQICPYETCNVLLGAGTAYDTLEFVTAHMMMHLDEIPDFDEELYNHGNNNKFRRSVSCPWERCSVRLGSGSRYASASEIARHVMTHVAPAAEPEFVEQLPSRRSVSNLSPFPCNNCGKDLRLLETERELREHAEGCPYESPQVSKSSIRAGKAESTERHRRTTTRVQQDSSPLVIKRETVKTNNVKTDIPEDEDEAKVLVVEEAEVAVDEEAKVAEDEEAVAADAEEAPVATKPTPKIPQEWKDKVPPHCEFYCPVCCYKVQNAYLRKHRERCKVDNDDSWLVVTPQQIAEIKKKTPAGVAAVSAENWGKYKPAPPKPPKSNPSATIKTPSPNQRVSSIPLSERIKKPRSRPLADRITRAEPDAAYVAPKEEEDEEEEEDLYGLSDELSVVDDVAAPDPSPSKNQRKRKAADPPYIPSAEGVDLEDSLEILPEKTPKRKRQKTAKALSAEKRKQEKSKKK